MEAGIERLAALCCFVVGLSHIVQPRGWAELFLHWREKGTTGVFYTALLHFRARRLHCRVSQRLARYSLVVTLLGWGWTVKGLLYLIYPKQGMRTLARVSLEKSHEFVIAGVVLLVLSGLIAYSLVLPGAF